MLCRSSRSNIQEDFFPTLEPISLGERCPATELPSLRAVYVKEYKLWRDFESIVRTTSHHNMGGCYISEAHFTDVR